MSTRLHPAPFDEQSCQTVAKPSDDPRFFLLPPPPGRSRESTIRLDAAGRFLHSGEPVEHAGLAHAMHTWVGRHPFDGRFVLVNGYDWTYFVVDDVPCFIEAFSGSIDEPELELRDGSRERWVADSLYVGVNDALYTWVKHRAVGGPFLARFTPGAQLALEPWLHDVSGVPTVILRGKELSIGTRAEVEAVRPLAQA